MKLLNRTTTEEERAPATPAEVADAEAREAERVEAAETAEARPRPVHGIDAAHDRFGGLDLPAGLIGMLTALASAVLLAGLAGAAIGVVGYQTGLDGDDVADISTASLIGGIAILFVAYLIGGWAAGRMARYDGARNGLMTGVWTIVLAAILSALAAGFGDEYDVLSNVDLPQWFDRDAITARAIVSGAVAVAAMLVAGLIGGLWGERYHRKADRTIVGTTA